MDYRRQKANKQGFHSQVEIYDVLTYSYREVDSSPNLVTVVYLKQLGDFLRYDFYSNQPPDIIEFGDEEMFLNDIEDRYIELAMEGSSNLAEMSSGLH